MELGSFVIMPNHMHGILIINPPKLSDLSKSGGGDVDGGVDDVETRHALSLQTEPQPPQPPQPPQSEPNIGAKRFQNPGKNTVSSIVGSYKSAVTRNANRLGFEFGWQSRFHDHIIRSDAEYQRINDYIETNPIKWHRINLIQTNDEKGTDHTKQGCQAAARAVGIFLPGKPGRSGKYQYPGRKPETLAAGEWLFGISDQPCDF
ncbi:transposase [Nitritalea halalkaliphila]|uniref:transposase n=1 Tax=Nitritalea halalkaliphila TaxID=590849 RepID=UPI001EE68847|nr:transposase [Nitritalea halalkaliphila]